jgi:2-oxoglutarate dehydrogenase E2 component (dihydrolipoamide succinyltransferase)
MPTEIIMPQMGESIAEGTITKWLKKVGEPVKRDEAIFEISTDKVDAEIPAPVAGTLVEIRVGEGQTVAINTVVGMISEAGEVGAAPPAARATAAEPPREPAAAAAPPPATSHPPEPAPRDEAAPAPRPAPPSTPSAPPPAPRVEAAPAPRPAPPSAPAPSPPAAAVGESVAETEGGRVESIEERIRLRSSPLVRKIASEHGVDIREIEGTGIYNRVTKNDILAFIENRKVAPAVAVAGGSRETARPAEIGEPSRAPAAEPAAPERAPLAVTDRDEIVAMTKIRRITAENMTLSKRTSAHVTTVFQVDYTNLARLRERHKEAFLEKNAVKLTYLPFIFRAAIQALKEFPQVNASIDGDNIVYHRDIHLGMAVALDWGLIVPVIKNADEKSILGLARAAQDLAERARTKRLKPEEIQGGTFTVTNPGVFGSLFGTPIIPQPQVAILGVGAIEKRPVVVADENGNDALGIRTVGYLALSFDHRLIDGADADRFLGTVKKTLEKGEFDLG